MADKIIMGPDGALTVSDNPIIPFIEGDGTGVDIWPAAKLVMDAAAKKHGKTIEWREVLAGQKAFDDSGEWLPEETVATFQEYLIGIKGPLTTPIGGGIRSLNVALRQLLDLYVCLRPVRWFTGVPSPVKHPEKVDMVIFRENTEDIYAGLEFEEGSAECKKLLEMLATFGGKWADIRPDSGIGIKPISVTGSKRLVRAAIEYALEHERPSVTMVHKGNIQKFTEGAFTKWGYDLVREEFADVAVGWDDCGGKPDGKLLVKDNIADITLQQVLTRPEDFEHRHHQLEWRLPLRRPCRPGRRDRHRPRRQHQLCDRPRDLRGDPRHRPQVRRPGQGQPRLGAAFGRDDVRAPRLAGGRRRHRGGA